MPYQAYNPTLVLRDAVRAQGYETDPVTLSIAYSNAPMGNYPIGALEAADGYDHPSCPTEAQALQPKGPGDVHPVKFSPHSSDQGM